MTPWWTTSADHPHVRGDYSFRNVEVVMDGGPSPRAWGLPRPQRHTWGRERAIPTCVGTTRGFASSEEWTTGPSPRAWGLPGPDAHPRDRPRAIPTCVGTTLDQDGKNTASPPVMCLLGNDYGFWFSRSPSEALARRFLYLSTCLDSFSAFRAASAFRTPTNTIPSKSRRKRSG